MAQQRLRLAEEQLAVAKENLSDAQRLYIEAALDLDAIKGLFELR